MPDSMRRLLCVMTVFFAAAALLPAQFEYGEGLDVPYVPSPNEVVETMLKLAEVKATDTVVDLGCGDGRIVVMAAERFGAKGIGYDLNPERIKEANENAIGPRCRIG